MTTQPSESNSVESPDKSDLSANEGTAEQVTQTEPVDSADTLNQPATEHAAPSMDQDATASEAASEVTATESQASAAPAESAPSPAAEPAPTVSSEPAESMAENTTNETSSSDMTPAEASDSPTISTEAPAMQTASTDNASSDPPASNAPTPGTATSDTAASSDTTAQDTTAQDTTAQDKTAQSGSTGETAASAPTGVSAASEEASSPVAESSTSDQGAAEPSSAESPESAGAEKKRVQIGSQRESSGSAPLQPKAVRAAAEAPASIEVPEEFKESTDPNTTANRPSGVIQPKLNEGPVPVPSKRNSSEALEKELDSIVGDVSMDDVVSKAEAKSGEEIELEGRYKGTVTRLHGDNVFFTLKDGVEGFASVKQFKKEPEVGLMTDVIVKRFNEEDGLYELSIPGASVKIEDWSEIEVGMQVEARVTGSNTGGLECMVKNLRGFIPASQIAMHRVENLGDYVNKKLMCVITEAKPKRKNLVLSHRKVLEEQLKEVRQETLKNLAPGTTVEGRVTRLREFGAFVDIGGVEGLVHISKLSWDRVEKPEDVLQEGQTVKVKIEKINLESGKIALSHRDTMAHPWEGVEEKYPADSVVKGTVSRIAQFGAFVRLEPGIEGLVHISELAHRRVVSVTNAVSEGEEVEVKILSVDRQSQKIGLSIKATLPVPEKKEEKKPEEEARQAPRELAVKKRRKPLKGGMDRRSGGDNFGLKW